ncbi:MAG: hypothetical protein JWM71_1612, partial [Solirubrobacteraceae bacterium]|nr:hypothetical protein [Solirubrobacteraceae bacterium]
MIGRRLLPATVAALALLCSPALAADPAPDLTLQSSF